MKMLEHCGWSFPRKKITFKFVKSFLYSCIFDVDCLPIVCVLILVAELFINIFIIHNVNYTEIDWKAYMQEVEGFINGTRNYALLKGDTGPLVYPAGFVYIYTALYYITSHGENIRLAQYIFALIHIVQLGLALRLYNKSGKLPPYIVIISTFTSYRIHSIYVLRLFNDPIAILFFYAALNLFLSKHWTLGSVFLSLGVSVKMNILLFCPAILLFYLTNLGYVRTMFQLFICGVIQLVLGAPFLLTYPVEYIKGSFNLGRVFDHTWTVNYRFLDKELFENSLFHLGLLAVHIILLGVLAAPAYQYFMNYLSLRALQQQLAPQIEKENNEVRKRIRAGDLEAKYKSIKFDRCTQLAILPIFLCNFIGMVCARSLHYQFYVWYFHSLPYLVFCTDLRIPLRILLLGMIELCWNTYPSTLFSSLTLHCCHIIILVKVFKYIITSKENSSRIREEN